MRIFRIWTGLLLFGLLGVANAQEGLWNDLNKQVKLLYQQGRYSEAIPVAQKALVVAESTFGLEGTGTATSLNNLGLLYHTQGRYVEAEPLYKRALAIGEKALGAEHPGVATALNNLAALYLPQGRYAEAEPLYKRAIAISEKAFGAKDSDVCQSLTNLARLYNVQGRYAEAEPLYMRALAIKEKALGARHPDVAASLNILAGLYYAQGRYPKAEPLYKRVLAINEKALGAEHPEVAASLNILAQLYRAEGRYREAEPLFTRALAIREKALGAEDPDVAASLNDLAGLYHAQGRYADAELLYKRALAIREKALGARHPNVAASLNNLARLYYAQGRYAEAEPLYKRALGNYEKAIGTERSNLVALLNNLAELYRAQARYMEAEPLYKRALAIVEKTVGAEHPDVARSLNNLARLYDTQGRYAQAEPLYKRALAIREKGLGAEHPDLAMSLNNLASLCYAQGRYAEAEPLLKRALAISEKVLGAEHPYAATYRTNLAELYDAQGRYGEAEPLLKRALAIQEKALGAEHPDLAVSLNNRGGVYQAQGRYAEAEPFYKRALAIFKKNLGADHPNVAGSLTNLAELYHAQRRYAEAETLFLKSQGVFLHNIALNFPALSETEKMQLYGTVQLNFERFNSFGLERKREAPAVLKAMFNNQLATKALLLNATSKVNHRIRNSGDTALVRTFTHWISTKEYLAKAYTLTKKQCETQGVNLDSLAQEANEVEKDLSRRSEDFALEYEKKPVTWEEVRSVLKSDEAGIEIVRFNKFDRRWTDSVYYAALIVTPGAKDHPDIVVFENGNRMEREYLWLYDEIRKDPGAHTNEEIPIVETLHYRHYWEPIQKALKGVRRVYVSLDGVYNNINLETLRMQDGKYLGEVLDIRVVTSLRDLVVASKQKKGKNVAALFGCPRYDLGLGDQEQLAAKLKGETQPGSLTPADWGRFPGERWQLLPGTEREVRRIDTLLRDAGWQTGLHMMEKASEEEVKRAENPRVLHIATHGFFQPDVERKSSLTFRREEDRVVQNPLMRSGLVLAGANRQHLRGEADTVHMRADDGILTAYEAMNLNLDQTELVVLSACETGLGEVKNGEGVYGLQRAFQVAGARYILMSLWKVDDEATQALITTFYREWLRSGDIRTGFKGAQRKMQKDYPSPYYWGAFVLVGV